MGLGHDKGETENRTETDQSDAGFEQELKEHLIFEHGEKVIPPTIIIPYE